MSSLSPALRDSERQQWPVLLLALGLSLPPQPWWPDALAAFAVFCAARPLGAGMIWSFFFSGLLLDVFSITLMGQHSLVYLSLMLATKYLQPRWQWYSPPVQALQMLPLFFLAHALHTLAARATGAPWPSAWLLLAPPLESLLWLTIFWWFMRERA